MQMYPRGVGRVWPCLVSADQDFSHSDHRENYSIITAFRNERQEGGDKWSW